MAIYLEDACYLLAKPTVLLNSQELPHADNRKAISWKDGSGMYFLNGVKFEEDMWKKITSHEMSVQEALQIEDIDQRVQALRYTDVDEFFTLTKSKKLHEGLTATLWKVPKGEHFPITEEFGYYVRYECPSTGRIYMSGITKEIAETKDADECMAWKHHMTKGEYLSMQLLVHQS